LRFQLKNGSELFVKYQILVRFKFLFLLSSNSLKQNKHILLPVWLSTFRYNNKVYQFLINARTGEVQGERPYSPAKITLAVVGGILLVLFLYFEFFRT
jgi:hypothetical protein